MTDTQPEGPLPGDETAPEGDSGLSGAPFAPQEGDDAPAPTSEDPVSIGDETDPGADTGPSPADMAPAPEVSVSGDDEASGAGDDAPAGDTATEGGGGPEDTAAGDDRPDDAGQLPTSAVVGGEAFGERQPAPEEAHLVQSSSTSAATTAEGSPTSDFRQPCDTCGGAGQIDRHQEVDGVNTTIRAVCPTCDGAGKHPLPTDQVPLGDQPSGVG